MINALTIVHVIVSVLLIIVILLQFGRGAEAGFFSDTSAQGVFSGPGPANLLTKITTFLAILFLGLAIVLANLRGHNRDKSIFDENMTNAASSPLNAQPDTISPVKKEQSNETTTPKK